MSAGIILGSASSTRLARGTTRLPISGTIGASNILIVGNTFALQDPQTYFLLASIRPAAPEFDTSIALELYDETAGAVITSYPFQVGPSSDPGEQSFSFVLRVVNPANLYSLRITVTSGGNPDFALSLPSPGFSLNVVLNGGAVGFLTGVAAPLAQVGNTAHLGTATGPITADALASAIWSPDAINHKALVLQALAGQTAPMLEMQDSLGNVLTDLTADGQLKLLVPPVSSAVTSLLQLGAVALVGGSAFGTYIGANPAVVGADFLNYQVAGVRQFKVDLNGNTFVNGMSASIVSTSGVYNMKDTDFTVLADATLGGFLVRLPNAATNLGRIYNVKKVDASANVVTVTAGGILIDGALNAPIGIALQSLQFQSDGANWWIL